MRRSNGGIVAAVVAAALVAGCAGNGGGGMGGVMGTDTGKGASTRRSSGRCRK